VISLHGSIPPTIMRADERRCSGHVSDTHSLFCTRGFDRATRASGIVLMKPFPLRSIPRDDAKGKEFPIDGADNGAAKTQRPSSPSETIFRVSEGDAEGEEENKYLRLTAISQKREILHYLRHWAPSLLPRLVIQVVSEREAAAAGSVARLSTMKPSIRARTFSISFDRSTEVTAWRCLTPCGGNYQCRVEIRE